MNGNCDKNLNLWMQAIQLVGKYQKLFITGCPKSGTTWMARLLNGHPEIVVHGEGRFAWRMYGFLEGGMFNFRQDHEEHHGCPLVVPTTHEFALLIRAMTDYIFFRYLTTGGKPTETVRVLADKTPQHIVCAKELRMLYPTCRFINIVRDPRDAATSALFHLGKNSSRPKAEFLHEFIDETWRLHVDAAIKAENDFGPEAILNIRYEDLHRDEASVLQKCLTFLGVDASDASIRACSQAGSFELLSGGRKRGQVDPDSFFRKGIVGDWINHIEPELAQRCCGRVGDSMARFGYANATPEKSIFLLRPRMANAA